MREVKSHEPPVVPESVWSALVRVYDTGQRLVLERIELAKLELLAFARGELVVIARQLARSLMLALTGAILVIAGWFVLSWGLVNLAAGGLSTAWRLVIDAGLNLALGGVLVSLALRGQSPQPEGLNDDNPRPADE
jgi:predicted phage tail protein